MPISAAALHIDSMSSSLIINVSQLAFASPHYARTLLLSNRTHVVIVYVLLATAAIDSNIVDSSRRDISLTIFPASTFAFKARKKNDLHISWSHAILYVSWFPSRHQMFAIGPIFSRHVALLPPLLGGRGVDTLNPQSYKLGGQGVGFSLTDARASWDMCAYHTRLECGAL